MTNTQLLRDMIATAQLAGNAIRSQLYDEAKDALNDVCLIAEILAHHPLLKQANTAEDFFNENRFEIADATLKVLIINANRLLGRI